MKLILLPLIVALSLNCHGQKKLPIYFDISGTYWKVPSVGGPTTLEVFYDAKPCKLEISLKSSQGLSSIKLLYNDSVIITGDYVNSLGVLRGYRSYRIDDPIKQAAIEIIDYYSPLRDGEWKYYDSKGVLMKTEIYDQGIFIKEI